MPAKNTPAWDPSSRAVPSHEAATLPTASGGRGLYHCQRLTSPHPYNPHSPPTQIEAAVSLEVTASAGDAPASIIPCLHAENKARRRAWLPHTTDGRSRRPQNPLSCSTSALPLPATLPPDPDSSLPTPLCAPWAAAR